MIKENGRKNEVKIKESTQPCCQFVPVINRGTVTEKDNNCSYNTSIAKCYHQHANIFIMIMIIC